MTLGASLEREQPENFVYPGLQTVRGGGERDDLPL